MAQTIQTDIRTWHYPRPVGFNPFRQQDKSTTDVVIVAIFMVIIVAVVLWAVLGG